MQQYLVITVTLLTHDGGTYLAETHAVAPSFADETETFGGLLDVESRTIEMGLAQGAANLKFLTNGKGLLRTHNLQFPDTAALATLHGDEVGNGVPGS